MDSDLKYQLDKIVDSIDDIKRRNLDDIKRKLEGLDEIKQKLQDIDLREIKDMLRDIKSRLESIEGKIQK
ncbi:MAG: hypothetical protein UW11_C0029G0009 [Parcubacteria group bacterium GW2011_GWA2_43_9b]|uniref:Uncharacterized protein n=1 Tax=Candidatus Portnoybacteria bacterium RIFCSPLOWO2_02_FULL_39_11 TaxID=1802001 RepID=A0A1G2FVF9_9BACT|nr:MAG: hypothetical protein UW11_C0029G0009 [Parcubacteria group bacterium GW2011_GWA2_43_9b]OGZ42059.1 MAG: hypothetical protein A3B04_02685 [Candidatus Portnoybacteria bacterium RIFCSPLOWO2_02_FULL_39_11]